MPCSYERGFFVATSRQGVMVYVCAGGTVWCVCLLTYRLPVLSCCCNEFILVMMVLTKSIKAGTLASLSRLRILTYACSLFCRSWLLILPLFQKPILFVGIHISMWVVYTKQNDRLFLLGDGQNPDNELTLPFFIVDDEEACNPVEMLLTYVTRWLKGWYSQLRRV